METLINFSGIGFEVGQTKHGLPLSTSAARNYFPLLKDRGITFIDHGDIDLQEMSSPVKVLSNNDLDLIEWDKYQKAYNKTLELLKRPWPLLNWGGDHSIAISTVGAFCTYYPDGYVVWIDAHADLNLPTHSLSGSIHGMPLAVLLNLSDIGSTHFPWLKTALDSKKLIYVGLRDVDPFEQDMIEALNIKSFFYKDIEEQGIEAVVKNITDITKGSPVHISFDIDSVDPKFAPSTGVPVKGGLTPADLYVLGEKLFQKSKVRSMDIVEVNPELGNDKQVDKTFHIAFNFLNSIFNNSLGGVYDDGTSKRDQREQSTEIEWNF